MHDCNFKGVFNMDDPGFRGLHCSDGLKCGLNGGEICFKADRNPYFFLCHSRNCIRSHCLSIQFVDDTLSSKICKPYSQSIAMGRLSQGKDLNTGGVSKHLSEMVADHKIDVSLGVGHLSMPKGVMETHRSGTILCDCTPQLTRESGLMVRFDNPNMNLAILLWKTLKHLHNKKRYNL